MGNVFSDNMKHCSVTTQKTPLCHLCKYILKKAIITASCVQLLTIHSVKGFIIKTL